jgi:hypothetical protein
MKCSRNLAHHHSGWIAAVSQIVTRRSKDANSAIYQSEDTKLLGYQFAGEAAAILNDDGPDIAAFDPVEQGSEALSRFDRFSTRDGSVSELAN